MSELSYRTFVGFLSLLGCLEMTYAVHLSGKKMFNSIVCELATNE